MCVCVRKEVQDIGQSSIVPQLRLKLDLFREQGAVSFKWEYGWERGAKQVTLRTEESGGEFSM